MSEPRRPAPPSSRTVWPPLIVAPALVLVFATIGSFAASFGVMTNCTNTYNCTTTSCRPCSATSTWVAVGWVGQGVLLLIGTALAVLGARRSHLRAVRQGARSLAMIGAAGHTDPAALHERVPELTADPAWGAMPDAGAAFHAYSLGTTSC